MKNCKLITCITSGGIFNKGELYPLYNINGYSCVAMLDSAKRALDLFPLDSYLDGTYKPVGAYEEAVFIEVVM